MATRVVKYGCRAGWVLDGSPPEGVVVFDRATGLEHLAEVWDAPAAIAQVEDFSRIPADARPRSPRPSLGVSARAPRW